MNELSVSELKQIQLNIMDLFEEYCCENNLDYYMIGGTAIGAIRHKGYIPWDDDIDVAMPRRDYEVFIKGFKNNRYEVVTCFSRPTYAYPFAKIADKKTRVIEHSDYEDDFLGVNIDVFPVDGLPISKLKRKILFLKRVWFDFISTCKCAELGKKRSILKNIIIQVFRVIFKHLSMNSLAKKIDKLAKKYSYDSSNEVARIAWGFYQREIVDKSVYGDYEYAEFEGRRYRLSKHIDVYLKQIYGDYMMLPPKEEQVLKHDVKAYYI